MRSRDWTISGILLSARCSLGASAGCNSSASEGAADNSADASGERSADANDATSVPEGEAAGPAEAVALFLEAVKNGQDEKANSMLTKLALQETAKMNMVVAPPGSETATFTVGEVELLSEGDEQGAQVASQWTDIGDDGQPHTDDIVWMLRKETEGWRIAGMATKVFEDKDPLVLNFEDPQDMQRKQQLAEEEMQRRMQAELRSETAEKSGALEASNLDEPVTTEDKPPARQVQRPGKKAAR